MQARKAREFRGGAEARGPHLAHSEYSDDPNIQFQYCFRVVVPYYATHRFFNKRGGVKIKGV